MSKWNLNKVTDFQRVTLQPGAQAALALAGLNPAEWDVSEGSFRDVKFHILKSVNAFFGGSAYQGSVSQIEDTGGRRKAVYVFPYTDGQTTDDLGRMAQTFSFDILIYGEAYLQGLKALTEAFDDPTSGILIHPIRSGQGSAASIFTSASAAYNFSEVVVTEYSLTHTSERRKCAGLKVKFIEHNFSIGSFKDFDSGLLGLFRKALNACLAAFATIDNIINAITANLALLQGTATAINANILAYKNQFAFVLIKLNITFSGPQTASLTNNAGTIPALMPVNLGGLRNPDGTLAATTFRTTTSPSDPFANLPVSLLTPATQTAIATKQAVTEVDSLRAQSQVIITQMTDSVGGQGALIFFDEINNLKSTAIIMQNALETALQSSKSTVKDYMVPRLMSLREVAFANGLSPEKAIDIEILNPSVLSVNFVDKGALIKVPIA